MFRLLHREMVFMGLYVIFIIFLVLTLYIPYFGEICFAVILFLPIGFWLSFIRKGGLKSGTVNFFRAYRSINWLDELEKVFLMIWNFISKVISNSPPIKYYFSLPGLIRELFVAGCLFTAGAFILIKMADTQPADPNVASFLKTYLPQFHFPPLNESALKFSGLFIGLGIWRLAKYLGRIIFHKLDRPLTFKIQINS